MDRETSPCTVFIGGPTCVYHNMMGMNRSRTTFVTPHKDDVKAGDVEDLIEQEVRRLISSHGASEVRLFTSCFGEFLDIDYEQLCESLSEKLGISCYSEKRCRICMKPGMTPHGGPGSPGAPGGAPMHGGPGGPHMEKVRGGDEGLARRRRPRPGNEQADAHSHERKGL